MSTQSVPKSPAASIVADLRSAVSQLRYEQLAFWRNPVSAIFTVGFSVIFLVLLAASAGSSHSSVLGGAALVQYYVPIFTAYGIMSASFSNLALILVVRRESGQLKRLRLSPLPVASLLGGMFLNTLVICAMQVVLLLALGRYAYHAHLPTQWLPLVLALLLGAVCFASIGVAVSSLVPNQEAGGPLINIAFFVLLFISGLWYPIAPGSALAKIANYFPVRHFLNAAYAPFNPVRGVSPWAWHDYGALGIWGVVGVLVALRRFRFEPRHR